MSAVTAWRTDEPCPVCAHRPDPARRRHRPGRGLSAACAAGPTPGPATTRTEVTSDRSDRRTTRAQRLAMPLARDVVKDLAVEHGVCIRPIQLRRTDLDTGEADTVLVPCGHTLAPRLPGLRRAGQDAARGPVPGRLAPRGRTRPSTPTRPPRTSGGGSRCAPRPSSSATRPTTAGQDTADLDELIARAGRGDHQRGHARQRRSRTGRRGGTARPGAARTPRTCPAARSARAPSARPTPPRTARPSGRRCSSP